MQDQQQLQELAYKYFAGEISNEESRALTDYIGQGEAQRRQFRAWEDEWTAANRLNRTTRQRWLTLQQRLLLHAVDGRLAGARGANGWPQPLCSCCSW
jgi:transmembrane sensor